jgi:hypothetical protein
MDSNKRFKNETRSVFLYGEVSIEISIDITHVNATAYGRRTMSEKHI